MKGPLFHGQLMLLIILLNPYCILLCFPGISAVKNPPANTVDLDLTLSQEGPLEKEMAAHFGILAGKIPRTEEPGRDWPIGLQRVGHR